MNIITVNLNMPVGGKKIYSCKERYEKMGETGNPRPETMVTDGDGSLDIKHRWVELFNMGNPWNTSERISRYYNIVKLVKKGNLPALKDCAHLYLTFARKTGYWRMTTKAYNDLTIKTRVVHNDDRLPDIMAN